MMSDKNPGTKLILLEGIPGSGKSTAGAYLQSFLEKAGIPVKFGARVILTILRTLKESPA